MRLFHDFSPSIHKNAGILTLNSPPVRVYKLFTIQIVLQFSNNAINQMLSEN